jgi:hypothetical protein
MHLQRSMMPYRPNIRSSFLIVFLLALTLLGCASRVIMYEGKEIEAGKQAIIRVEQEDPTDGFLGILSVDGRSTNSIGHLFSGLATEVAVLPGKHTIFLRIDYPFSFAATKLWLVAEAGVVYVAKCSSKWNSVAIWIENERTGQPVGGVSGSDDEPKGNTRRTNQYDKPASNEVSR